MNKYQAELADFSFMIYEKFLHKIYRLEIPISLNDQIMLYCFLHKGISINQLSILFINSYTYGNTIKKENAMNMRMKRLRNKNYFLSLKNMKSLNTTKTKISDKIYIITSNGLEHCAKIIPSLFYQCFPSIKLESDGYTFTLDEIIEYLSKRCLENIPAYWNHYLGTRDINTYLLASSFTKDGYRYETEVSMDENGTPISMYLRTLLGVQKSYPIRSDALLRYPLVKDKPPIKFFIELDTGSQSSTKIKKKMINYKDFYLDTRSFSPLDSLILCLQTSVNEKSIKSDDNTDKNSIKDYYYVDGLQFAFDLLKLTEPKYDFINTFDDAISFLNELKNSTSELPDSIKSFKTLFNNYEDVIPSFTQLSYLKQTYNEKKGTLANRSNYRLGKLHKNKYQRRRTLLQNTMLTIDGLNNYFLRGFSLYTVSAYFIKEKFQYLLPEMFDLRSNVKRIFLIQKLIKVTDITAYKQLYSVDGDSFALRNSYTFSDTGLHVIMENISDDLGGRSRILHLLDMDRIPPSLSSSKILCLCDDGSLDNIRDFYLGTKLGKKLANTCSSTPIKDQFEILFATYETFRIAEDVLIFNAKGEKIYKKL